MIVLNQFSGNQVKGSRSKAGLAPQALVPFKTPLKASEARWLSTTEGDLKGEVRVENLGSLTWSLYLNQRRGSVECCFRFNICPTSAQKIITYGITK